MSGSGEDKGPESINQGQPAPSQGDGGSEQQAAERQEDARPQATDQERSGGSAPDEALPSRVAVLPDPHAQQADPNKQTAQTQGSATQRDSLPQSKLSKFLPKTLTDWLLVVATIALAVFTGLLSRSTDRLVDFAAKQAGDMEKSLAIARDAADAAKLSADIARRAQRAWIAPYSMRLEEPLVLNERFTFSVNIKNTGNEPALNVSVFVKAPKHIQQPPDGITWALGNTFDENLTCTDPELPQSDQTIYPTDNVTIDMYFESSGPITDPAIIAGNLSYSFQGCVAYETLGEKHQSAFCFFLLPEPDRPSNQWHFHFCPRGNAAN